METETNIWDERDEKIIRLREQQADGQLQTNKFVDELIAAFNQIAILKANAVVLHDLVTFYESRSGLGQ